MILRDAAFALKHGELIGKAPRWCGHAGTGNRAGASIRVELDIATRRRLARYSSSVGAVVQQLGELTNVGENSGDASDAQFV